MRNNSKADAIFRHNVRVLMESRGLTITDLGELAGTNRPGMSMILAGKVGCTLERAERISMALGFPLASLIGEKISSQHA